MAWFIAKPRTKIGKGNGMAKFIFVVVQMLLIMNILGVFFGDKCKNEKNYAQISKIIMYFCLIEKHRKLCKYLLIKIERKKDKKQSGSLCRAQRNR